jgi:hypothetical protein
MDEKWANVSGSVKYRVAQISQILKSGQKKKTWVITADSG